MLLPCFSMVPQHQEKSIIPNVDNDGQSQISQLQLGEEASADGSSSHPPSTSGSSNEAEAARSSDTSSRGGLSSANSTGNSSLELFGFTRFYLGAISTARWVFLGGLLVAALGLATSVFLVLEKEENDAFEAKFENLALEVIEVGNEHVRSALKLMDGVSTTVTSFIDVQRGANSTYPSSFMTLPHMEQHFGTARNASGALILAYVPLVKSEDLELWSRYSFEFQDWIGDYNDIYNDDDEVVESILVDIWDYPEGDEKYAFYKQCKEDEGDYDSSGFVDERIALTKADGPFSPVWTFSPAPRPDDTTIINHDLFGRIEFQQAVRSVDVTRRPMFLDVCKLGSWFNVKSNKDNAEAVVAYPVLEDFSVDAEIVGHMIEIIPWGTFFENILPDGTKPLHVVLESSCGQVVTYKLSGREANLIAETDVHNAEFSALGLFDIFAEFANSPDLIESGLEGVCVYSTTVYPTPEFRSDFNSNKPVGYALVVLAVFLMTSILFFMFDGLTTRQRDQVMDTAKKQNAIVSSLFPKNIQAKMMQQIDFDNNKLSKIGKAGLKSYLLGTQSNYGEDGKPSDGENGNSIAMAPHGTLDKTKPIADLFPETTIMFGDIAGFTAWSSVREPSHVFTLLETIYHEFDTIARRRRVFKVEVVGDCYVAVCGLPDPKLDHACVMAKFAMECVREMDRVTQELEVELGPDTTELRLRVGLHSGPVVAGVLRGEKSRFQLFGDTMNTAARMESTGMAGMVQVSEATAELLMEAKKMHWLELRGEDVTAKGKGKLTTYFLKISHGPNNTSRSVSSGYSSSDDNNTNNNDNSSIATGSLNSFCDDVEIVKRRNRIADWTVETLAGLLKDIEIRRRAVPSKEDSIQRIKKLESSASFSKNGTTVIGEVKEIIELPKFDVHAAEREAKIDPSTITLPPEVFEELRDFVRTIAALYHANPFHNFPHANHVTMSVVKLLSRIVAPDVQDVKTTLHDHTYGITSDPLTRFAVVLSALIHDIDHMGVPNAQLINEKDPVAQFYNNQSVAEQNSIDIAWELLMESRFDHLRHQIYTTESEFRRFRQLLVNTVLATDIMDNDLKTLRNKRWEKAFSKENKEEEEHGRNKEGNSLPRRQNINRKATIVIEHLIQASDVAHTMQHWHIYRKWNDRLFQEMYKAWEEGRMEQNPAKHWYKGELGFLDYYVIPLAKKLKDCGVFGVSSDEYLSYALQNRKEWESRGEQIVEEMVQSIRRKKVAKSIYAMDGPK